ncbi:MAG: N-acetylneuraminate synthase [Bacillota bacterium]
MSIYIIAEAGVNHNGSLGTAKKLIDAAAEAGCDAVKFQSFCAEKLVTKDAAKARYQTENTGTEESQYEMLKKLELDYEEHKLLMNYCRSKNIEFLSTPFDTDASDMLDSMDVKRFKISSGDITNKPLLVHVAKKNKPIILSTGMATLEEIDEALQWIYSEGNTNVILLHCTSNYPTDYKDANLTAMMTMKQHFKLEVGYSDHTIGIEIPIAAAALGAAVVEKHFTLDRTMVGPDHKASLEPKELSEMVKAIRNVESALGDGVKKPVSAELDTKRVSRKSIVTTAEIYEDEIITLEKLTVKRPGTGIEPKYIDAIIGKRAKRALKADYLLSLDDLY